MNPDTLRTASTTMLCMGIAATIAVFLDMLWPLAAWALILAWLAAGLALDVIAERAQHANELDVERLRRERRGL